MIPFELAYILTGMLVQAFKLLYIGEYFLSKAA